MSADRPSLLPHTRTLMSTYINFLQRSKCKAARKLHTEEEQARDKPRDNRVRTTNGATGLQERSYSSQWKRFRLTPDLKRPSHWV